MNYAIFRADKLKSHAEVVNCLREQHRAEGYDAKRADPERSNLNTYSGNYTNAQNNFDTLLPKKYRKNAVLGLNFVISTSQECESAEDEKKYYEEAVKYLGEHFGQVVGWAIHRDETSTHLQAVTIPLVNGKLNARALIGGDKSRMREIQSDFWQKVGKPFGLERGKVGSRQQHKTAEELHREEQAKIDTQNVQLDTREKSLSEREEKLQTRENDLAQEKSQVSQKKREYELLDEKSAEVKTHLEKFKLDENETVLPDFESSVMKRFNTPEALRESVKPAFGEKPEKYAHMLIKYVWDYAKKRVTKFAQKYNEMKSALASMTWCYKRELDKSQKLERDLESYDYRKKTPEELRDLAAAKERKIQQQQSRKPSKGFGNSYSD